jgi:4-amino-4-deoxy-L-arabinose transferase-like glycosyltransferase
MEAAMGTAVNVERRETRGPEWLLAGFTALVFFSFMGSVELWGKREQRAAAEALDTVEHGHWLVAEIQNRPRLEKPPLPRWVTAGLMEVFGRHEEWVVRFPSALAALGMVGLAYGIGRRLGGREQALVAGFALASSLFFVTELRQAGNDGPLAFFTALAIYAVVRRLHGRVGNTDLPGDVPGARGWNLVMGAALGGGFLCKGPIGILIAAMAVVGYLASVRRLKRGLALVSDWRAGLVLVVLALSWPVLVLWHDPNALRVWLNEMGQKTGASGIRDHQDRHMLALEWFWMTAPWTILATAAVFLPWVKRGTDGGKGHWLPWWWTVGNLAMFSTWSVAKPNYFLPCMPGVAVLVGMMWVHLAEQARGWRAGRLTGRAGHLLRGHWVAMLCVGLMLPVVASRMWPGELSWAVLCGLIVTGGVVLSLLVWREGGNGWSFLPQGVAVGLLVVVGYGGIAPRYNAMNGHKALAQRLEQLTAGEPELLFFREIDEGLWFYLRRHELKPVPKSQPRYNKDLDLLDDLASKKYVVDTKLDKEARREQLTRLRNIDERQVLLDWLRGGEAGSRHVLIRARTFDQFRELDGALDPLVKPVLRESGLGRTELMLLEIPEAGRVAKGAQGPGAVRR